MTTKASAEPGRKQAANQRADAQRNRAKILAATVTAIRQNSDASVAGIAAEAGVGRMTLYGHFKTRLELIRSEEHTSELQSRGHRVCRLLLGQKHDNRHTGQ